MNEILSDLTEARTARERDIFSGVTRWFVQHVTTACKALFQQYEMVVLLEKK